MVESKLYIDLLPLVSEEAHGFNVFDFGRGIVTDSSGNVYASALGFFEPARLFRIDTPGTCSTGGTSCSISELAERETTVGQFSGLAIDGAGNLFVAGGNGDDVLRLDTPTSCSTGGTPCTITTIIDSTGDGSAVLDGPGQVAVASTSVFVAGGGSDNVFRIDGAATSGFFEVFVADGGGDGREETPALCRTGRTPCAALTPTTSGQVGVAGAVVDGLR